jgi:hypothetical protein
MPWLQVQILLGPRQEQPATLPFPMRLRDLFQARNYPRKSPGGILEIAGILLLLLYLIAGVIYSAVLPSVAQFSDAEEYLQLSNNMVHGPGFSMDGIHLTASRPPGYAFFLSAIRAVGGGFFAFRVAQFLLLGATIFLLYRLGSGRKMFAGLLIVTSLVICYPILFYISATIYPQTLSGFLFILALALTLVTPRGLALNLVTGISYGALILAVPTFLFTMVIILGVARFLKMIRWRDVLLMALAASFVIGAWTLRNAVIFHRFVPIASNSGLNFLVGNNGSAVVYQGAAAKGMEPYYYATENLDEFQTDNYYWHAALSYLQEHPWRAFIHYLERVLNFFNTMNAYATQNAEEFSAWKQIVMAISYALLLALLGWRLADIKRFPLIPREKLFLAVYVLSAFTSAIFLTRIRLRLPFDYLVIAIIAWNLSRRLELWMTANTTSRLPSPANEKTP